MQYIYIHTYLIFNINKIETKRWKIQMKGLSCWNKVMISVDKKATYQANNETLGTWQWYIFNRSIGHALCCSCLPTQAMLPWLQDSTTHKGPQWFIKEMCCGGQAGSLAQKETNLDPLYMTNAFMKCPFSAWPLRAFFFDWSPNRTFKTRGAEKDEEVGFCDLLSWQEMAQGLNSFLRAGMAGALQETR